MNKGGGGSEEKGQDVFGPKLFLDAWSRRASAVLKTSGFCSSRQFIAQGEGRAAGGRRRGGMLGLTLVSFNIGQKGSCNKLRLCKCTEELHCRFWKHCKLLPEPQRYPMDKCWLWNGNRLPPSLHSAKKSTSLSLLVKDTAPKQSHLSV